MNESSFKSGYSLVNGLRMYYEIYGEGKPLVLIHGGGSNLQTSFGNIIPLLSRHRQIVAMDLQAHGRTADRPGDLSFEQDADDVAALLHHLKIEKADFLGYSNGAHTLIEIALRHPEIVHKLIIASSFYNRSAVAPQFWESFDQVTIDVMPESLKDGFLKVNDDQQAFHNMFNKDVKKMKSFKGWSDDQMKSIKAPALIINGNDDLASAAHTVEMHHVLADSQLLILPGKHGAYLGAIENLENGKWTQPYVVDMLNDFLNA